MISDNNPDLIPVHFLFDGGEGRHGFGWWVLPVVPSIGDSVALPGLVTPGVVVGRLWKLEAPPQGAMSMHPFATQGAIWIAVVTLGEPG